MSETERIIHYKFQFDRKHTKDFTIPLDNKTMDLLQDPPENLPPWTKLSYHKCPNCPLDEQRHEHCPIAVSLVDKIDFFNQPPPSDKVEMTVKTPERTYSKNVDFKLALRSLLGIYMVTSGCPIMDKLRSMVRFHLPFATRLETTYRSIAHYLIAQYLIAQKGNAPDWELKNLESIYKNIDIVNKHFRERLKEADKENHSENTFFALDIAVDDVKKVLNDDTINEVESLFQDRSGQDSDTSLAFQYQFKNSKREIAKFTINIDSKSLKYISHKNDFPSWTELKCHKCPNCPLDEARHTHCPAATAVSETIEFFRETLSTDEGTIKVSTANRDYSKNTTISDGVSAMMGLVMASSGCPILSRLKPLVRQHLPFATQEETAYRSLGLYLLSQSFLSKSGGDPPDWKLEKFTKLYEEINVINKAFCDRLRESHIEDASLNALVKLDCFAQLINFIISDGPLKDLQQLFEKYTDS